MCKSLRNRDKTRGSHTKSNKVHLLYLFPVICLTFIIFTSKPISQTGLNSAHEDNSVTNYCRLCGLYVSCCLESKSEKPLAETYRCGNAEKYRYLLTS